MVFDSLLIPLGTPVSVPFCTFSIIFIQCFHAQLVSDTRILGLEALWGPCLVFQDDQDASIALDLCLLLLLLSCDSLSHLILMTGS